MQTGVEIEGLEEDGPAKDGSGPEALALSPPVLAALLLLLDFPIALVLGGSNTSCA